MAMIPSRLTLENGTSFSGFCPSGQAGDYAGEVVFNTGMTGYVESLTDPSYIGQILVFTYPLIGNYGVPAASYWESKKIHVRGVVLSEASTHWSHREGTIGLLDWLKKEQVPVIVGVDTRALTKLLRESGVMRGVMTARKKAYRPKFRDENNGDQVAEVSIKKPKLYIPKTDSEKLYREHGGKKIIVVDCGMKENILRCLREFPLSITRVPYDYDYTKENWDGVFISNGPGDPAGCTETIRILIKAMALKKPIFGICLGSQLMALAAGAKTYKLPYGHRGHNQPCREETTGHCVVTSQNHGYAVEEKTLPKTWYVSYRNLNDGSVEGIAHKTLPFFSVQFHPEAAGGPTDTKGLFEAFYRLL